MRVRAAWGVAVAGGLLMLVALAAGGWAAIRFEGVRAEWKEQAEWVGEPTYDAAESDALYERTRALRADAGRAGWLGALGLVVLAAGLGSVPSARVSSGREEAPLRAWGAFAVDFVLASAGVALVIASASALGASHAGFGGLLEPVGVAALLGGAWGSLARGVTPGARMFRVRFAREDGSPGAARAAASLALAPLSVLLAPLLLALSGLRREVTPPPHLSWTGLRVLR